MTIDEVFTNEELIEATKDAFGAWFSNRAKTVGMDETYWKTADIADAVCSALTYADLGGISIAYPRNIKRWEGAGDGK